MKSHFTDGETQGEGSDKVSGKNPGPVTPRSILGSSDNKQYFPIFSIRWYAC